MPSVILTKLTERGAVTERGGGSSLRSSQAPLQQNWCISNAVVGQCGDPSSRTQTIKFPELPMFCLHSSPQGPLLTIAGIRATTEPQELQDVQQECAREGLPCLNSSTTDGLNTIKM